jgi:hypothetical protein
MAFRGKAGLAIAGLFDEVRNTPADRSRSSVFGHTRDLEQPEVTLPPGFALNTRNQADGLELLRALERDSFSL